MRTSGVSGRATAMIVVDDTVRMRGRAEASFEVRRDLGFEANEADEL